MESLKIPCACLSFVVIGFDALSAINSFPKMCSLRCGTFPYQSLVIIPFILAFVYYLVFGLGGFAIVLDDADYAGNSVAFALAVDEVADFVLLLGKFFLADENRVVD